MCPGWRVEGPVDRYAALLRGVNVGGHARLEMARLAALMVGLGHTDVTTYLQSGNVVFSAPQATADRLARAIEECLARELDLSVTVFVRSAAELAELVAGNPFLGQGWGATQLHVTFLPTCPDPVLLPGPDVAGPERFALRGRELYLCCPAGYGRARLANPFWERRLGMAVTTRNWNTVTRLRSLTAG